MEEIPFSSPVERGVGAETHDVGGVTLVIDESPVTERSQVGLLIDNFRDNNKRAIEVLFTAGERPGVHVAVTDDLISQGVRAGELAQRLAAVSGGKGGGRPHFASGGIGDTSKVSETRTKTPKIVAELLGVEQN